MVSKNLLPTAAIVGQLPAFTHNPSHRRIPSAIPIGRLIDDLHVVAFLCSTLSSRHFQHSAELNIEESIESKPINNHSSFISIIFGTFWYCISRDAFLPLLASLRFWRKRLQVPVSSSPIGFVVAVSLQALALPAPHLLVECLHLGQRYSESLFKHVGWLNDEKAHDIRDNSR